AALLMESSMLIVLLVIGIAVAAVLVVAAGRPNTYRMERTTTIEAAPERIFPLIADLRQWPRWSAFETLDPAMKRSASGAAGGTGAVYEGVGNGRAGEGRMEITETASPASATVKVDFKKPFDAHNVNRFVLEPHGRATRVVWSMQGTQPFML